MLSADQNSVAAVERGVPPVISPGAPVGGIPAPSGRKAITAGGLGGFTPLEGVKYPVKGSKYPILWGKWTYIALSFWTCV